MGECALRVADVFFQAEDGIRDYKVTGVQTCALSISALERTGETPGTSRRFASTFQCRDRKSTRLNSSHLVISYAVFCLKKNISNMHKLLVVSPDGAQVPLSDVVRVRVRVVVRRIRESRLRD